MVEVLIGSLRRRPVVVSVVVVVVVVTGRWMPPPTRRHNNYFKRPPDLSGLAPGQGQVAGDTELYRFHVYVRFDLSNKKTHIAKKKRV